MKKAITLLAALMVAALLMAPVFAETDDGLTVPDQTTAGVTDPVSPAPEAA